MEFLSKKINLKCGKAQKTFLRVMQRMVIGDRLMNWLRWWETGALVLVMLIAFITPFEAGFLGDGNIHLGVFNMFILVFFMIDFGMQFFLPFSRPKNRSMQICRRWPLIAKNYLSGWFVIDLLSVLPFEFMTPSGGLVLMRSMRLLRLLKLLKLLRAFRILEKWQDQMGISYRKMTLLAIFLGVLLGIHWIACAMGLMSRLQLSEAIPCGPGETTISATGVECTTTWLTAEREWFDEVDHDGYMAASSRYSIALLGSITFVVHPFSVNPASSEERPALVALGMIGGFIWSQVISRSTAICTSLDKHNIARNQMIDDVNQISKELGLSSATRRRLRLCFVLSSNQSKLTTWNSILVHVSPQLRRDVSRELNRPWVQRIPFLRNRGLVDFITDVSEKLVLVTAVEEEHFGEPRNLYIMRSGTAKRNNWHRRKLTLSLLFPGDVWGEDHLLLTQPRLLSDTSAVAMQFVQCHKLSKLNFDNIMLSYPSQLAAIRRYTVQLAFRRVVGYLADERRKRLLSGKPGYTEYNLEDGEEHKLDSLSRLRSMYIKASTTELEPTVKPAKKYNFLACRMAEAKTELRNLIESVDRIEDVVMPPPKL